MWAGVFQNRNRQSYLNSIRMNTLVLEPNVFTEEQAKINACNILVDVIIQRILFKDQ